MNRETLQASVNYGDFEGSSEADWRTARGDTLSFDKFAEAWGVDIKKYHPIGIRVAVHESRAGIEDPDRRSSVEILALENQRGAMPEDYAEQQKEVPYVGIPIAAKVSDVLRNIERFEVVLVTRRLKGAPSFEQVAVENLS